MLMNKRDLLSNEFKVASQIYECNIKGDKVWFTKLTELLKDLSAGTVHNALKTLLDWGIVKCEYGATEKGRAGRLLLIANESKPTIKEIYESYWRVETVELQKTSA